MLNMPTSNIWLDVEHSVGAIYLTVMNLPWYLRFNQQNVMLIGLIPKPKEPEHDINPLLVAGFNLFIVIAYYRGSLHLHS